MSAAHRNSRIFTFYTYNGGAGCSTAVANVACILKSSAVDRRVLVVDWDLESPTLAQLFINSVRIEDPNVENIKAWLDQQVGLIDMLRAAMDSIPEAREDEEEIIDIVFEQLDLDDYILELGMGDAESGGAVHLLKAGKLDDRFASRVSNFRWDKFRRKAAWFLPELVRRLFSKYDYVLIDAATGRSEASRVCTTLLPDALVVVFPPNDRALTGVVDIATKAVQDRVESEEGRPLRVFPLPSRLEKREAELLRRWRKGDEEQKLDGFQATFEKLFIKLYDLKECDLETYFDEVGIPNVPKLAQAGRLPALCEREVDYPPLLRSYQRLAHGLSTASQPWDVLPSRLPPKLPSCRDEDSAEDSAPDEAERKSDGEATPSAAPAKSVESARSSQSGDPSISKGMVIVILLIIFGLAAVAFFVVNRNATVERTDDSPTLASATDDGGDGAFGDVTSDAAGDTAGSDAEAEAADEPCPTGRVRHADTDGHCCFPGQVWSSDRGECLGDRCPTAMVETDAGCACPEGMELASDEGIHCCWPGQEWSSRQSLCVGAPTCPEGWIVHDDQCFRIEALGSWRTLTAGSYQAGSPAEEVGRGRDEVRREVTLTHGFLIMTTEVTQAQYERIAGNNPSRLEGCSDCPVERVTWHEAAAFCNKISEEAELPLCYTCTPGGANPRCTPAASFDTPYDCPGFRLPTEAEWEYAARAGGTSATGSGELDGERLECEGGNPSLDEIAWYCGNASRPQAVGGREANGWEIRDMLGNITEWCHDRYGRYSEEAVVDPVGTGGATQVCRGGSWGSYARDTRLAKRYAWRAHDRSEYIGFRVVRTLAPTD